VHFDTKMKLADYNYEWKVMSHGRRHNMRKLSEHNLKWGSWVSYIWHLSSAVTGSPWFAFTQLADYVEDSLAVIVALQVRHVSSWR